MALVSDMASYPGFVPNCSAMEISNAKGDPVYQCNATMHMSFGPISQSYTSLVTLDREAMSIVSRAGDGLFSHLVSHWRFFPEGEGTRIQLRIDFEIANPVIRAVLDPLWRQAGRNSRRLSGRGQTALFVIYQRFQRHGQRGIYGCQPHLIASDIAKAHLLGAYIVRRG